MKNWKIWIIGIMFYTFFIACTKSNDGNEDASKNVITTEYSRCYETSYANMAEIENGFFYCCNCILYYADKEDMSKWVAVCNKPDCMHNYTNCNAYVDSNSIAQKEDKLYIFNIEDGVLSDFFQILEILQDGSGTKEVCSIEITLQEKIDITRSNGFLTENQAIFYVAGLTEDGMFQKNLIRMKADKTMERLKFVEQDYEESEILVNAAIGAVRGDDACQSSFLTGSEGVFGDFYKVIWNIEGDKLERIELPEHAGGKYLSDNMLMYFKENEGYYKMDLTSKQETLLYKNQIEDSKGYMFTEDYIVECNYNGDLPEEIYLKFFNGENWIDVSVPEKVKESTQNLVPYAMATDRIFLKQGDGKKVRLYYFMLDTQTPELIYCSELNGIQ